MKHAKKDKSLILYLLLDYEHFITANKKQAIKMMSELYLEGINMFLPKRKDFDYNNFYLDVKQLFEEKKWIVTTTND